MEVTQWEEIVFEVPPSLPQLIKKVSSDLHKIAIANAWEAASQQ